MGYRWSGARNLGALADRFEADLRRWRIRFRVPGAALIVSDADGPLAVSLDGLSDLAAGADVRASDRFQIGSISKTATAICILQAAEAGRIGVHDPVRRHLPWFDAGERTGEITIHHLLSHLGGLPNGGDSSDASPFDVWALRDVDVLPPGERYWYSNAGYKALSCMLAAIHDRPFPAVLRAAVLDPLGMTASRAKIDGSEMDGAVVGHEPRPDTYPISRAPIVASASIDVAMGDGCIAATPDDMGAFAAALLRMQQSDRPGGLLGPTSARALVGRHARTGPGKWYGYGLGVDRIDGRRVFGHGGDMLGFRSSLIGDPDAGVAVVVLANLRAAPTRILARHVLRTLVAARSGVEAIPLALDDGGDEEAIEGQFGGPAGAIEIGHDEAGAWLGQDNDRTRLLRRGDGVYELADPTGGPFLLRTKRAGVGRSARVEIGSDLFVRDAPAGSPGRSRLSGEQRRAVGTYRSHNPWRRRIDIIVRDGRSYLVDEDGEESPLVRLGKGRYRIGREPNPERLVVDADAGGQVLRAIASGQTFYRVT